MIVKISSGLPEHRGLLLRQTPQSSGVWKGITFVVNQPLQECDWWIIIDRGLIQVESVNTDPRHIVYVSMESPEGTPTARFLDQFSTILSCDNRIRNRIPRCPHTWWVGAEIEFSKEGHRFSTTMTQSYDTLSAIRNEGERENRIAIITSRKNHRKGHQARLNFIDRLMRDPISEHIDFYGGMHRPIRDKYEVLSKYKYHLCLENAVVPDYWTEKLADAYLAGCFPIYSGCPNISEYFPGHSFFQINIKNFDQSVTSIARLLDDNTYDKRLNDLQKAKHLVLNTYNIFDDLARICFRPAQKMRRVTLFPHTRYRVPLLQRALSKLLG